MKDFLEKITKLGPFQITLLITIISISLYSINPSFLNIFELKLYDLRFKSRGVQKPGNEIVIVKIDEESMEQLGRWPWSRDRWVNLIDNLVEWGAKVIGIDVIFAGIEESPDNEKIARFRDKIKQLEIKDPRVLEFLEAEERNVDADSHLATCIGRSGSVVLGYFFLNSNAEIKELKENASSVFPQPFNVVRLAPKRAREIPLWEGLYIRSNIDTISAKAKESGGLGFMNVVPDDDGTVRWVPLVMRFQDDIYPSLGLKVLSEYLGDPQPPILKVDDYGVRRLQFEETIIPTDERGQFLVNYRGWRSVFPSYSFSKVISGDVPREKFQGKIVLIGATAVGLYDARVTPFGREVPGVEIHATVIDNILNRDFILRPLWIRALNILMIILMALIPGLLIPRLSPSRGAPLSMGLFAIYAVANWYLLVHQGMWINLASPFLAFSGVFVAVTVYQYVTEEREKRKIRSAFQFFVSPGVVNEILRDPGKLKLGGERKVLTVLFSDLREFTHLSETLSPDTLTKLLNLFLTPMTDIVFKYQGTLDKYMGDAIMAFFGAPLEQEDHAEKACRTALDMVKALRHVQKNWEIDGVPEISMGIGINTGPMSVGNMGSDVLFDYTVVGDHVNLGSRLEKLNREYGTSIIISEFTHELDIVRVRGRTEPVRIFELLGREEPFHQWPAFKMLFEKGLLAYRSQRWDEGIGAFEEALKIRPDDGPANLYLRRCRLLRKRAPSPVWDGVYQMRD
jgi:adenylate cyclase